MPSKRAVIVDDNPNVLSLISDLTELMGFDVQTFQCPVKALSFLKQHDTDIVLTDYRMPHMDGLTLTREIRKINLSVPIMMITADADNFLFKQTALNSGVDDIISKPFDFAVLDAKLQCLLKQERVLV